MARDPGSLNEVPPQLTAGENDTFEELTRLVARIVLQDDGSIPDLSSHKLAEQWYRLESEMNKAVSALNDMNDGFEKAIKSLRDQFSGVSADAFHEWAKDVLRSSQQVHTTLKENQYPLTIGNVGHAMQWFANEWWKALDEWDKEDKNARSRIAVKYMAQIELAQTQDDIDIVVKFFLKEIEVVDKELEWKYIQRLQGLVNELGRQYTERGQDMVPFDILRSDKIGSGSGGNNKGTGGNNKGTGGNNKGSDDNNKDSSGGYQPRGGGSNEGSGGGGGNNKGTGGNNKGTGGNNEESGGNIEVPDLSGLAGGGGPDLGGSSGGGGGGGRSPSGGADSGGGAGGVNGALDEAKKAAQDAIDSIRNNTGDPEAQQALDEARQKVGDAIDQLKNTGGGPDLSGLGGAGSGGAPGGLGGLGGLGGDSGSRSPSGRSGPGSAFDPEEEKRRALEDAKKATQDVLDDLANNTEDPEAKRALEEAKQAAQDAIDGLTGGTDPGNLHSRGSGDAEQKEALDRARRATQDALDKISEATDNPAIKEALENAKKAAQDALNQFDPDLTGMRDAAKQEALDVLDELAEKADDPKVREALEDAKEQVKKAIENAELGNTPQETLENVREAAQQALADAIKDSDDPKIDKALEDAKDRLEEALEDVELKNDDVVQTSSDGPAEDPEAKEALRNAKDQVSKALEDLIEQTDDPEAKQALQEAKKAVVDAIDNVEVPRTGAGSDLARFLEGDSPGGAGGGDPVGGDGRRRAQFDTDVAQQRGYIPPQTVSSVPSAMTPASPTLPSMMGAMAGNMPVGGMPMGGMPMGMGGMGMGQQNGEREPQIWLKADKEAWADGDDDASSVVGRTVET